MSFLVLVGGQQQYLLPMFAEERSWYEYQKGIIIKVDAESCSSTTELEYVSPQEAKAEIGSMLFKAGSIQGDRLYLCTTTEILIFCIPDMRQIGYVTHPLFNDVHHVAPTPGGNIVVANSGLDVVIEVNERGEVQRIWDAMNQTLSPSNIDKNVDYRPLNTKPHHVHPNYVFFLDDELWVTRFYQKDAVSLTHPGRRIDIAVGSPHDGVAHGDYIYFTTVNGNIVVVNRNTLKREEIIDLNAIHNHGGPLAWSRGIGVDDDKIWVGFSRLRPTKLKENVDWAKRSLKWKLRWLLPSTYRQRSGWMKRGLKKELPTRIACYDPKKKICLQEINVEQFGLSAVFSIFPESLFPNSETRANLMEDSAPEYDSVSLR